MVWPSLRCSIGHEHRRVLQKGRDAIPYQGLRRWASNVAGLAGFHANMVTLAPSASVAPPVGCRVADKVKDLDDTFPDRLALEGFS